LVTGAPPAKVESRSPSAVASALNDVAPPAADADADGGRSVAATRPPVAMNNITAAAPTQPHHRHRGILRSCMA
jgi:hypothetical protein